jgi:hypothetical protein
VGGTSAFHQLRINLKWRVRLRYTLDVVTIDSTIRGSAEGITHIMAWFSHSGDLGDIVYSLPAIRAAGGGTLYLFHNPQKPCTRMTRERADLIRPLLLAQDYIDDVIFWEAANAKDHPLNQFRDNMGGHTIADGHLLALGNRNLLERNRAWLRVDDPREDFSVVFNRTSRYQNPDFPWKRVWEQYGSEAAFLGLRREYEDFCKQIGEVAYLETADLLQAARVIAGSRLFVGNQSCPYAIAEGLKVNAILEVSNHYPNCCFPRIGVLHGRHDSIELPEIETLRAEYISRASSGRANESEDRSDLRPI